MFKGVSPETMESMAIGIVLIGILVFVLIMVYIVIPISDWLRGRKEIKKYGHRL